MTFLSGQVVTAAELNALVLLSYNNEQLVDTPTTTSTSYVSIGTTCGTAFVAPASGNVEIKWFTELKNSGAGNVTICTIAVRTGSTVGSGTTVYASSDNNPLCRGDVTGTVTPSAFHPLTGLTPGANYNVQLEFRVSTGTGTAGRRGVTVTQTN